MAEWNSETGGSTPKKPAQILVPETPSPSFSRTHQDTSDSSPVFNFNRKPLFKKKLTGKNGFNQKSSSEVLSHPRNFEELKKQSAFEKLRAIRQKKVSSSNSPKKKSYNRSRAYSMWPSDSESDSDQDTLESVLNQTSVKIGKSKSSSLLSSSTSTRANSERSLGSESSFIGNSSCRKSTSAGSPILPLRKRIKLQSSSESSGARALSSPIHSIGTHRSSPDKANTNKSSAECRKKLSLSRYPDFMSAGNMIPRSETEADDISIRPPTHNDSGKTSARSGAKQNSNNDKGKRKVIKANSSKRKNLIGLNSELNGETVFQVNSGISEDSPFDSSESVGLQEQDCSTDVWKATATSDSGLKTSNFYKKPAGKGQKKTSNTSQRRGKKSSTSQKQTRMTATDMTEKDPDLISSVTFDIDDNDAVVVINQLETDESMARKLQEELDREFALSLAQTDSPQHNVSPHHAHLCHQPQGHVYSGQLASGLNVRFMESGNSDSEDETYMYQPFQFMSGRNRIPSPLAVLSRQMGMWDGGNNWTIQGTRRQTRQARGGLRGRRGRRNAVVGFSSPGINGEDYETLWNLAESVGDAKPKGLTKSQIDCLPVRKFAAGTGESNQNKECLVCMCEFENNDRVRILTCFHDFHAACIDKWLKSNNTCPICRVEVQL